MLIQRKTKEEVDSTNYLKQLKINQRLTYFIKQTLKTAYINLANGY